MGARVLIIGAGDVASRFAMGLAASGRVGAITLAGLSQGRGPETAGLVATCCDCLVRFEPLDATRQGEVEALLRRERPDLVVQAGSLLSPWTLLGRRDPLARAIAATGLGLQLPVQLPILLTVMRAAQSVGHAGPIANVSFPDATHPILDQLGLAPTIGLGNVSMIHLRVRAALRERDGEGPLPPIRVIGHHRHVYGVMAATPPAQKLGRCHVHLGEAGERADELAYAGQPIPAGLRYNEVTAASALPVMLALLPGAAPLRFSAPAPHGLPGGYPVRIAEGRIDLDLPEGVALAEAVAFNRRIARADGIEAIASDGTVSFTEAARRAVAGLAPELAEPLPPDEAGRRASRLLALLNA